MSKKALLSLLGLVIFSFIYITACENPGSSLEESVAPYLELQAVEEASNTVVTVNRGESVGLDSYFALDLKNIKPNGFVNEGLKEGWCLEWNKAIDQNNDVHTEVEFFNTHGSDTWKPANYLMNIKNELKQEDPSLTYREIQVALWSLIEVPAFNIDKALDDGTMPSRMMRNGKPNFSVEKTKQIVNRVRSDVSSFEYNSSTPVIAFMNTNDSKQNTGVVVQGTMFAYGDGAEGSLTCNNDFNLDRWGWAFGYDLNGGKATHDFLAGAGSGNEDCDADPYEPGGSKVGVLEITYSEPKLSLKYIADEGVAFKDPHIWVGCNRTDINLLQGSPPAGFPYPENYPDGVKFNDATFEIDISDYACDTDNIYISAHAGND